MPKPETPAGVPAGNTAPSQWWHVPPAARRQLLVVMPLSLFAVVTVVFLLGLNHDPNVLPSMLIGHKTPAFALPPVQGRELGLASENLVGEISLVNVFASWCAACRVEHPLLMGLAENKTVAIHGLDYKDRPVDAAQWLNSMGDPYTRTGADLDGRVAIDFGVYGVPETFVVGADGIIAYKHIGALTPEALNTTIMPLVERLRQEAKEAAP